MLSQTVHKIQQWVSESHGWGYRTARSRELGVSDRRTGGELLGEGGGDQSYASRPIALQRHKVVII